MEITKKTRRHFLLESTGFISLFLIFCILLAWLSTRYNIEFDWTATGRYSLSDASLKVLEKMDKPISITSYISNNSESDITKHIRDLIRSYHKHKSNIELNFIDTLKNPDIAKEQGIQIEGEMIVKYGNRSEHVNSFNEAGLTNALQRMLRVNERKVLFVSGHGEHDPQGRANYDYGIFFQSLSGKGIQSKKIALAKEGVIPSDTTLLVIAGAQVEYLDGEIKLIKDYLDAGGSLLWLHDPQDKVNLSGLAKELYIKFLPGTILDTKVKLLGINDPTIVMATEYPPHAITQNFQFLTLYPHTGGIETEETSTWKYATLLQSVPESWLEKSDLRTGAARFDPKVDILGPIKFGVAGTRTLNKSSTKTQRVVIIGDGDFGSNQYLGNQGNQQFFENVINWLVQDDSFIEIPTISAIDTQMPLTMTGVIVMGIFFFLLIPGGLTITGIAIWLRRRKR